MLGMITYQSEESMERKFGGTSGIEPRNHSVAGSRESFQVESYLRYQGQKLVRRFDATTYLYLLRALDLYDLGRGFGGYEAALERIQAKVLVVGVSSDILYPAHQQKELVNDLVRLGKDAEYVEIESPWGHDTFLIEIEKLGKAIRTFLGKR
jgi:homoserine O-acetyltransferase